MSSSTKPPYFSKTSLLLDGRVGPTILQLSLPMLLGILSVMLFQVADTFYIGRLGTAPLAALSFTFPLTFLLVSLSMGLSVGTASVVAQGILREVGQPGVARHPVRQS